MTEVYQSYITKTRSHYNPNQNSRHQGKIKPVGKIFLAKHILAACKIYL